MTEIPAHVPPTLGGKIQLDLRGVIGFFQIVLQIMVTVDSELLRSQYAEKELLLRLSEKINTPISINKNRLRAFNQINSIFRAAGFIAPDLTNYQQIVSFLVCNHFIHPINI